jgi:hypothetical membrane protein
MIAITLASGIISAYLLTAIVYFAHIRSGYSHWRDTISELGETGALHAKQVSYYVFLIAGLLLIMLALIVCYFFGSDSISPLAGLLGCAGTGYAVAGIFPCDKGAPLGGSAKQQIHNAGGFIEYIGGAFFMMQHPDATQLAYVVIASAVLISLPPLFSWRGLIQRVGELALFSAMILMSLRYD